MIKTPKKDLFAIKLKIFKAAYSLNFNDQFLNSRFTITLIIQLT